MSADSFLIPDSIRAVGRSVTNATTSNLSHSAVELAAGVIFLPGDFNAMVVAQTDGIVEVDAPMTSQYSREVLAEIARRFPGRKVKALIVTDFMWAHMGGLREYVARGIPIYAPLGQAEIIRRVVASRHGLQPDSLARAPRPLLLRPVNGRQSMGSDLNRIELLTANRAGADYGERMLVAYLPESRILYTSDLLPSPFEENFVHEGLVAVSDIVVQEHLAVDQLLGTHLSPTPWLTISTARDSIAR
jgi:hypothetical protein